jgi:alkanesulfonate monooxygenase SsuD/methylene tetrahydromethanopterin reductase-like flavin-dependent oxidoreductase (luciferase family)
MVTLGRYGARLNPADDDAARIEYAVEAELLSYGTVWLGLGQRDESDLRLVKRVLDATSHVVVATAIVNMWTNDPATLAQSFRRLQDRHPDRFLLGAGVGHPESIAGFRSPYQRMESSWTPSTPGEFPVSGASWAARRLLGLGPRPRADGRRRGGPGRGPAAGPSLSP